MLMKLSVQAQGALMMALQKCILEQMDIKEILESFLLENTLDGLVVVNPPTFKVEEENTSQLDLFKDFENN